MVTRLRIWFSNSLVSLSLFLFLSTFIYINYIAAPTFHSPVIKSLGLTFLFFGLLYIADIFFEKTYSNKSVYYLIIAIVSIVGILFRLYWINSVDTIQVSDFARMWESATEIAQGNYVKFQRNNYLYTYPHLAFTTLFYSLVQMIFGSNVIVMKLINLVLTCATCYLVYMISSLLSNGRKPLALLIMAFNFPFIFFNNILDSQNIASPLLYLAVYFYLCVFNKKLHPIFLVLVGVLLSIGNLFRSVGIIFVIAMIMHMMIFYSYSFFLIRKKGKPLKLDISAIAPLCLILMLLAMYITTFVLNYLFILSGVFQKPTWDTGGNLILYINAGFNHESNGMWNQEDYNLLRDVNYDYNKAEIEAKKRLSERLSDKDKVMTLISNKYRTQWGQGDYAGLYWSTIKIGKNPPATNDLIVWFNYHYYLIQSFYSALILAIIIKLINGIYHKDIQPEFYFGLILFIGFVCLHTLIEMQPRYGYIAMPMISIMAASSIGKRSKYNESSI